MAATSPALGDALTAGCGSVGAAALAAWMDNSNTLLDRSSKTLLDRARQKPALGGLQGEGWGIWLAAGWVATLQGLVSRARLRYKFAKTWRCSSSWRFVNSSSVSSPSVSLPAGNPVPF